MSPVGVEWDLANATLGALWGKRVVDSSYYLPSGLPGPPCRGRVATALMGALFSIKMRNHRLNTREHSVGSTELFIAIMLH